MSERERAHERTRLELYIPAYRLLCAAIRVVFFISLQLKHKRDDSEMYLTNIWKSAKNKIKINKKQRLTRKSYIHTCVVCVCLCVWTTSSTGSKAHTEQSEKRHWIVCMWNDIALPPAPCSPHFSNAAHGVFPLSVLLRYCAALHPNCGLCGETRKTGHGGSRQDTKHKLQ